MRKLILISVSIILWTHTKALEKETAILNDTCLKEITTYYKGLVCPDSVMYLKLHLDSEIIKNHSFDSIQYFKNLVSIELNCKDPIIVDFPRNIVELTKLENISVRGIITDSTFKENFFRLQNLRGIFFFSTYNKESFPGVLYKLGGLEHFGFTIEKKSIDLLNCLNQFQGSESIHFEIICLDRSSYRKAKRRINKNEIHVSNIIVRPLYIRN